MTTYQDPVQQGKTNTLAIISLVGGILSLLLALLSFCIPCGLHFFGMLFGAGAAIMGFVARNQINESAGAETGQGMATGGLILGIIAVVIGILSLILGVVIGGLFATLPAILNF